MPYALTWAFLEAAPCDYWRATWGDEFSCTVLDCCLLVCYWNPLEAYTLAWSMKRLLFCCWPVPCLLELFVLPFDWLEL